MGKQTKMSAQGYLPPHSLEVEQSVLGALIVDKACRVDTLQILSVGCFYKQAHAQIFSAIQQLYSTGEEVDMLTIASRLNLDEAGGYPYLVALTQKVGSGMHARKHAMLLYELYSRRELIRISQEMGGKAYGESADISDIINQAQNDLLKLFHFDTANVRTAHDIMEDIFSVMDRNHQKTGELSGIGTGLSEFDTFSGGLQKSDLVIVAGETSQGKTSLTLTMSKNAAVTYGAKVAFYSLEMSNTQLVGRLMAQETGVSGKSILTHQLDRNLINQISRDVAKLDSASIYFDDSSTTKLDSILRSIRSMKVTYGIDLVVVDYLQLVKASANLSREQHVAEVARSLKNIAKELDICVIALSQLSRSDSKKPSLNRLRDSGQIEEAADVIMLIYRPEFYNLSYDSPFEGYSPRNSALIDIAKGRNIGTKQFIASFKPELTQFCSYVNDPTWVVPEKPF